jgi:hypothetical protein
MRKKSTIVMVCIFAAALLMSAMLYAAEERVTGVAMGFDAKTGILVMQTATQKEVTFSIPQTVKVFVRSKGKDEEVADAWPFLKANLMRGTKLQLRQSGVIVTTIWILEIPR